MSDDTAAFRHDEKDLSRYAIETAKIDEGR